VGMTSVDERVQVMVIRKKRQKRLSVKIGKLSPEIETRMAIGESHSKSIERLGISVSDLTDEQLKELPNVEHGVLVRQVRPGLARDAGIQRGDVILQIQSEDIKNVARLKKIVKQLRSGVSVAVLVQRRGSPVFLAIKLED